MTLLAVTGISKGFLGVRVLHDVDLDVDGGEVHAVVGENGAGKSTLMKTLAGVHTPDSGTITVDGLPMTFSHPSQAQAAGIGIIHQEFTLLPERTVAENVFLGREPTRRGLVDRAAMERHTARLLAELDETSFGPRTPVRRLSVAQQQVVEIVKALSTDARVLIMDEPTAALADHEVDKLYALVRRLAGRGLGILYISHRLREVFDLSARVTVIKDGRRVATLATVDTREDEIVRLMVGRELGAYYPPRADPVDLGDVRLAVRGAGNAKLADIDLELRAGQVVGIAGLQGSGRTSLARALFGASPFTTGTMHVDGRDLRPRTPARRSAPVSHSSGRTARPKASHCANPCETTPCSSNGPCLPAGCGPPGCCAHRAHPRSPTCSTAWRCAPEARTSRCATCPAATSKRSSSPSGSGCAPECSSSTSPRAASTSARRPPSTTSSANWRATAWRCSWSRPSYPR